MKKKTTDKNIPVGKLKQVKDVLPPPSELLKHAEKVKKKQNSNGCNKVEIEDSDRYFTAPQVLERP